MIATKRLSKQHLYRLLCRRVVSRTITSKASHMSRSLSSMPETYGEYPSPGKWDPRESKPSGDNSEAIDAANTNHGFLSPTELNYFGHTTVPITSRLHIVKRGEDAPPGIWPAFRLMDENGHFRNTEYYSVPSPSSEEDPFDLERLKESLGSQAPALMDEIEKSVLLQPARNPYADTESKNTLLRAHRLMIRLREMDVILQNAQRQGRISFYMTCRGEEAIHIGAAAALSLEDTVLAQYREAGILMWRGFSLQQFADQCFSNTADLGKGRQMPIHYGSRALNYHTISSPLGTQLPQAVGAAYRLKLAGKQAVAACFFGDGAASTTDFHSALNFAATLRAPVVFFCRNNGFAISTPVEEQYAGDGIVSRAPGYGMAAIRVDGNDAFAVAAAVREARKYAIEHSEPVLIEAMTYRSGHHSTSDDSTRYRNAEEVKDVEEHYDPVLRMESFLALQGWMSESDSARIRDDEKIAVLKAMQQAENKPKPPLESLFEDVYHEIPPRLKEQQQRLKEHMAKYPEKY